MKADDISESPSLLAGHTDANAWADSIKKAYLSNHVFDKLLTGVVWTNDVGEGGEPIVPIDPSVLVEWINTDGLPLLKGHDPGFPVGRVLAAEAFTGSRGVKFVAAIFGYYSQEKLISFRDLGLDSTPAAHPPRSLPPLPDGTWIQLETDPREVDSGWLEDVIRDAPLRVERKELSHNAAEPLTELIRIGLPYIVLVWNPFVKSIATEAGKDAYAGICRWLQSLWEKLGSRRSPIVQVVAHQNGCQVSFLFRGNDVGINYTAHEALSVAAAQAAQLLTNMKERGVAPRSLVYEFESRDGKWFPSYAELRDGRLISDRNFLIAVEQMPSGLSLGISRTDGKPRSPG